MQTLIVGKTNILKTKYAGKVRKKEIQILLKLSHSSAFHCSLYQNVVTRYMHILYYNILQHTINITILLEYNDPTNPSL